MGKKEDWELSWNLGYGGFGIVVVVRGGFGLVGAEMCCWMRSCSVGVYVLATCGVVIRRRRYRVRLVSNW